MKKEIKTLPNGVKAKMDVIRHNGVAVVLPVNKNKLVLIRQYRPVVNRWLYEFPAGTLEKGEKPMDCAVRELKEETGFTATKFKHMFSSFPTPGMSTEVMHFFLAYGLKGGKQILEKDEIIRTKEFSLNQLMKMIRNGKIVDGKTIQGLLYYYFFEE